MPSTRVLNAIANFYEEEFRKDRIPINIHKGTIYRETTKYEGTGNNCFIIHLSTRSKYSGFAFTTDTDAAEILKSCQRITNLLRKQNILLDTGVVEMNITNARNADIQIPFEHINLEAEKLLSKNPGHEWEPQFFSSSSTLQSSSSASSSSSSVPKSGGIGTLNFHAESASKNSSSASSTSTSSSDPTPPSYSGSSLGS